ncbi:unnamed protein product, partial [Meganyctiphanes norvegica]
MRNQTRQNSAGRQARGSTSSSSMGRAEAPSLHMECETESLSQAQIDKALRIKNELAKLHNLNFRLPNLPVGGSLVNGTGGLDTSAVPTLTNGTANMVGLQVPQFLLLQNGQMIGQSTTMATAAQARSQTALATSSSSLPTQPPARPVRSTRVVSATDTSLPPKRFEVSSPRLRGRAGVLRSGNAILSQRSRISGGVSNRSRTASNSSNNTTTNTNSDIQVIGQRRSTAPAPAATNSNVNTSSTSSGTTTTTTTTTTTNKFFPMLYVVPRPKSSVPTTQAVAQRKDLDLKVKAILVKSAQEFVEYLLQEGLVRTSQSCQVHKQPMTNVPMKLKLGMFSDPKVLSTSGGYVWISDCCGKKYVSVYSGSIFGSTPIDKVPPSSVLKLIYHWACQTSIQNVESWVKVDKMFINKMYQYNRCVCSVILHEKVFDFGFDGTTVELGIVSLGTSTADGNKKAVKVEILGLYDRKMKSYRLFASEPEPGSNSRQRFMRILKPMERVVHRNAIILCDQSVDRNCLYSLSFVKVSVCDASDNEDNLQSNGRIMSYLRRHVPKMFQSTLSQLSLEQVQVVLDELCWREKYGMSASQTFNNLIEHIQLLTTKEAENPGVLHLLDNVSENPLQNWNVKASQGVPTRPLIPTPQPSIISGPPDAAMRQSIANMMTAISSPVPRAPVARVQNKQIPQKTLPVLSPAADQNVVQMEPFYYAQIQGTQVPKDYDEEREFVCHICKDSYINNIEFYTHMKKHLTYPDIIPDAIYVCKYCTEIFETEDLKIYHMKYNHMLADVNQRWCRICCESMSTDHQLVNHMIKKHQESEMPYRCEICNFSTSFYFSLVDHFDKEHSGSANIQCHYCLVTKVLSPGGASTFSMRVFQHMQKHKSQTGKCKSCVLTFYSKYLWEEHKKKEHVSRANTLGLQRYKLPAGARAIHFRPPPKKIEYNASGPASSARGNPQNFNQNSYYTLKTHENLSINAIDEDDDDDDRSFYCIECDGNIKLDGHYKSYQKCIKCPYATCCRNMMVKHVAVFHPTRGKKVPYKIGPEIRLSNTMYCVCGFSTLSGNHLARHLAKCEGGRYSGYPTMSAARPGGYGPMVSMPAREVMSAAPAFDMSHFLSQSMDVEDDADEPMEMPVSVELDD